MLVASITLRPEINIQNVVCTADLKQSVDIASFNKYEFLSSNLDLYRCGYVKDDKMIGRVTVFHSGKLISVGTKTIQQAEDELKQAGKILQKHKLIGKFTTIPKVQNIVGRFDLQKKLNILTLARTMPKALYEPEQFPGLIFRIQNSLVALIFASGKGVLAGGKSISELNQGLYEIEQWIK